MRDNEGLSRTGALLALAVMIAVVIVLRPGSEAQPLDQKAVGRPAAPSDPSLSATGETRADMAAAGRAAAGLPRLHSLLVSWRDELILEHYGNGGRGSRPANVKSASKSIISTLVGIAIDRGHIKSVHQPIADYFPELRRASDPRKQK